MTGTEILQEDPSLDMNAAEEPNPYPQEQQQKQQRHQTSNAHAFRSPHGLRLPTPATITGGRLWCSEENQSHWTSESRRWWHRRRRLFVSSTGTNCTAAACRAEAGAGAKSVGNIQTTLPPSAQQRWGRARARPFDVTWGVLSLLLLIYWWPPSNRHTGGGGSAVLVLGASVSVGFGGGCPNACSSHGYCTGPSTETCECHQGWAGGDCSIREYEIFLVLFLFILDYLVVDCRQSIYTRIIYTDPCCILLLLKLDIYKEKASRSDNPIPHLIQNLLPNAYFTMASGLCPSGTAWVDRATGNNTAHAALTECSNMGVCDRVTGRCSCRSGFTGEACQRMGCPTDCNGRGRYGMLLSYSLL